MTHVCPSPKCNLTSDSAVVVKGSKTIYRDYNKPPYNRMKWERVRCSCGQFYVRRTAIYQDK